MHVDATSDAIPLENAKKEKAASSPFSHTPIRQMMFDVVFWLVFFFKLPNN